MCVMFFVYFVLYVYNCVHERTIKYLVSCILISLRIKLSIETPPRLIPEHIFFAFQFGVFSC